MSLTVLNRGRVRAEFAKSLEQADRNIPVSQLCLRTSSDVLSERYGFADSAPAMKPYTGVRRAKQIGAKYVDLTNEEWDNAVDLSINELQRDQTGTIQRRIGELATRAAYLPWRMIQDTLLGNRSPTGYDGVGLFSASHVNGSSGTQTNILTNSQVSTLNIATATAPTPEEAAIFIPDVVGYMLNYKDDEGEPMHETASQFLVLCHPNVWPAFNTAINANALAGSRTNPLSILPVSFGVVPCLKFSSADVFYLARVDSANNKPFILQTEQEPTLSYKAEGSDYAHDTKRYQVACDWRGTLGIGEPLSIVKCTMS